MYGNASQKIKEMLNKCQSPPPLLGVTSSPKESSARLTGTPTLEGVGSCRFGVSLSQLVALKFCGASKAGTKWEKSLACVL